jgi:hypothetical protein
MNSIFFTEDAKIDLVYPASQESLLIKSNGFFINGFIEIAQGKGPHSTILLLHGFPGTEKNTDLAHVFRRAGFNVVIFSYRGSWGSKGNYSFYNCFEDCQNVIDFLIVNHLKYRINKYDLIVIGYSFGGFLALYIAYVNSRISKIASISGFHLQFAEEIFRKFPDEREKIFDLVKNSMNALEGTKPEIIMLEIENVLKTWEFRDFYSELSKKHICLISGLKDDIIPPEYYHFPLIKKIEEFQPKFMLHTTFYDAGHSYSDHRIKLTKFLLEWLKTSH